MREEAYRQQTSTTQFWYRNISNTFISDDESSASFQDHVCLNENEIMEDVKYMSL